MFFGGTENLDYDFDALIDSDFVSLKDFSESFLLLDSFGFHVSQMVVDIYAGENLVKHFREDCGREGKALKFYNTINLLTFSEEVINTSIDVSEFCPCYLTQKFSEHLYDDYNLWCYDLKFLTNFLLFDETPVTDLLFFNTVTLALKAFKESVENISYFFSSQADALFENIILIQEKRLQVAKDYFLNDEKRLVQEFKKLTTDEKLLTVLNTGTVTVLKTVPFSKEQFSVGNGKFNYSMPNKFLNLIGSFYMNADNYFFVAPEVFVTLWEVINLEYYNVKIESEIVNVCNFDEFIETLTVLCPSLIIFEDDFESITDEIVSFDAVKFKELVTSATILTNNK